MLNSVAYAQGVPAVGGSDGSTLPTLMAYAPLVLIFVVFYFLIIRPQQQKAKSHKQMLESLKKGDRVVTVGGVIGSVTSIAQDLVTLQVSDTVRIKPHRNTLVRQIFSPPGG